MKYINRYLVAILAVLILVSVSGAQPDRPAIKLVAPTSAQLVEGQTYYIKWGGTGASSVTITAEGILTSRPSAPRGPFSLTIAENIPAEQGAVAWLVPYLDTVSFTVHITGFDSNGQAVGQDYKTYNFRPLILSNRKANGIYIDLTNPARQRMYVLRNKVLIRAYLTSGAYTHVAIPRPGRLSTPFDPVGVFRVIRKIPMYWSNEYQVWMTNALQFYQGHFIHGTYPSEYQYLGKPASHGCIRLDRTDAKELYDMTPIGTRVEIFPY